MADTEPAAELTAVNELSFEQALRELEAVVARLESGEATLEDSISLYARGAELRAHCETKLKAAEARVAEITQGPDGTVSARTVDIS